MKLFHQLISLLLCLSFLPSQARVNTGSGPYCSSSCPKCKPCTEGEGDSESASDTNDPYASDSSFYFNFPLGVGHTKRPASLLTSSRLGAVEGMIYNRVRGFDAVFRDSYGQNTINRLPIFMEFEVAQLGANLFHPSIFNIYSTASFERLNDTDNSGKEYARQIVTDTTFTHVSLLDPAAPNGSFNKGTGFRVRSWKLHNFTLGAKVNGFYPIPTENAVGDTTPLPYSEVIFKKPGTSDSELVTVYRQRFGVASLYEKTEHRTYNAATDLYVVTTHAGNSTAGAEIRKEELQYSARGAKTWDYTLVRTVSEASTTDGIGTPGPLKVIARTKEVFEDFTPDGSGGEGRRRLMQMVKDYGNGAANENITTNYDYYDDPNSLYIHGRPKSVINHDKSWEYYEYVDQQSSPVVIHTNYSSWKDVPFANYTQGRCEELSLTRDGMERVTTIQGQQIAHEKETISMDTDGRTIRTSQTWTGSEWATTVTCYNRDNESKGPRGRIRWIEHADGTATNYSYGYNGDLFMITREQGAGDRNDITDGVKTVRTYNEAFKMISEEKFDIPNGNLSLGSRIAMENAGVDNLGRPIKWIYNGNPDDFEIKQYGCCGLEYQRARSGATATYFRDPLKRVYQVVRKRSSTGSPVTTVTDFDGLTTSTKRTGGGTTLLVRDVTRNLAGTLTTFLSPDADNLPDADGDPSTPGAPESVSRAMIYIPTGGTETTTTYPDLTTTSTTTFIDGRKKSSTDQEGNITTYEMNIHNQTGGGLVSRVTQPGGTQWMETYRDQMGRALRTLYPDGAIQSTRYHSFVTDPKGSRGKIAETLDPDENQTVGKGSRTTYIYSADGDDITTTRSLSGGQQMVSSMANEVIVSKTIQGVTITPAIKSTTTVNGVVAVESYRSIDGRISGSESFQRESLSQSSVPVDGSWTNTRISPNGSQSRAFYEDGLMKSSVSFEDGAALPSSAPADITNVTDNGFVTGNSATHDAFGRILTQTDARTGTTNMGIYLENDSLLSVTDPGNRTTSFGYDAMGRRTAEDAPDTGGYSNITYTSYTPRGQLLATWGDQTYPRLYQYDGQGRMTQLHTWKTAPVGAPVAPGEAVTEWKYHAQRGWLTEKNYDGETDDGTTDADYQYTLAGRLSVRTWERGITTTYSYDQGLLETVTYSDNTPDLAYSYDSFGRMIAVNRGGNPHASYTYDPADLTLVKEHLNIDTSAARYLVRAYENSTGTSVNLRPSGWALSLNSDGTSPEHSITYGYGPAGRLVTVSNLVGDSFEYTFENNSANLIEKLVAPSHTVENGWAGTRNLLSQKLNLKKDDNLNYNPIISTYAYGLNSIGQREFINRASELGVFAQNDTFTVTYNSRGEVVSSAKDTASDHDRAYSYDAIGNRVESVSGTTTLSGTGNYSSNALNQYTSLPSAAGAPQYDADGNATNYSLPVDTTTNSHSLEWDAENRLTKVITADNVIIEYDYDYLSRRISKTTGGVATSYFYDGWNCIAQYQSSTLQRSYTWGLDLSGSMQGAGGVGGLLSMRDESAAGDPSYYPTYDGNGNVSEYLTSSGSVAAHFEYDPFGNTVVDTDGNNFFDIRFSTKKRDDETGLYYYGYRYYDPQTGRWPSRDPIEEEGGYNLYGFIGNDGINYTDYLGLKFTVNPNGNNTVNQLPGGMGGSTKMLPSSGFKGQDQYRDTKENGKCCSQMIKAKRFDMDIESVLLANRPNNYTAAGWRAVRGHEDRRVSTWRKAYNEYLSGIQAEAKKPGKMCCKAPGVARANLEDYVKRLRLARMQDVVAFVQPENAAISRETPIVQNGKVVGIGNIHKVGTPSKKISVAVKVCDE